MASQLAFKSLKASFLTTNRITHNASISHAAKEKLKSLKIPDKPKKPMAAFFRFIQDRRENIRKEKPEMKLADVSKQCAVEWATLHTNIKDKYNVEYQDELQKYAKLNLEYQSKLTDEQKQALKDIGESEKKKKERREIRKNFRDEDKPKRPLGPYPLFLVEHAKKEGMGISEVIQSVKGKWQQLPESERQRYQKIYDEDKKRYDREMLVWEKKMIAEGDNKMAKYEDFTEEYQRTLCDIESNFQENLNTFYNNNCNQEARRKYRAQSFDDVGYTFADHQILLKTIKLNTQPKFELVSLAVSYKNMVLDVEFKVNDLELSGDYNLISDLKDNKSSQGKISFEVKNIKFKGKIGIFIEGDSFMATNYNLDFNLEHTESPQLIKDTPVFPLLEISLKSHLNKHVLFRIVSEIVEFSVCEMFNDEPEHLLYRNYVNARAKQANEYFESTYKKFVVACNHLKTVAKPFTIIVDNDDLKSVEVTSIALQNISGIERQNNTSLYQSEIEEIYYTAVDLSNVKYAFTCKFNYANSSEDRTLLVTFYYNTVMFTIKKLENDKWDVTLNIEELKNLDMEENELEISESAKETVGAFLAGHARYFTNEALQNIAGNLNK